MRTMQMHTHKISICDGQMPEKQRQKKSNCFATRRGDVRRWVLRVSMRKGMEENPLNRMLGKKMLRKITYDDSNELAQQ